MKLSQYKQATKVALAANIPILGVGDPGGGKSEGSDQACIEEGYNAIVDWRGAEMESIDTRGVPREKDGRTYFAVPEELPVTITSGKDAGKIAVKIKGKLIVTDKLVMKLDEIGQAKLDVKNIFARLLLERRIGEWHAPEATRFIALTNKIGTSGTSTMPSHLNNRLWHVNVESSLDDWIDNYVEPIESGGKPAPTPKLPLPLREIKNGQLLPIDSRIVAYMKYCPDQKGVTNGFDPRSKEAAFASFRAWTMLNRMLYTLNGNEEHMDLPLFQEYCAGFVGQAKGGEFAAFARTVKSMISIKQILLNPTGVAVPVEPSICFAVAKALASQVDRASIEAGFVFTGRMRGDFSQLFAKTIENVQPALMKTKAFVTFAATHPV